MGFFYSLHEYLFRGTVDEAESDGSLSMTTVRNIRSDNYGVCCVV